MIKYLWEGVCNTIKGYICTCVYVICIYNILEQTSKNMNFLYRFNCKDFVLFFFKY